MKIPPASSGVSVVLNAVPSASIAMCIGVATLTAQQASPPSGATKTPGLTESQIVAIEDQIAALRMSRDSTNLKKNSSAEDRFSAAAASPDAALALYMSCYRELNFTRLNKPESEYRDWKEANEDNLEFEPFTTALQLQLAYLSLVTRAAQEEDVSTIFGDLAQYMARFQELEFPPHPELNSNISQSVFARAFELDDALRRKQATWELNPLNISGIYEKTILPYLRTNSPEKLDNAWNARIAQEVAMARLFAAFEDDFEKYREEALEFQRRNNDGGRGGAFGGGTGRGGPRGGGSIGLDINRMAQFVRQEARAAIAFQTERLPVLHWERAEDRYIYGPEKALAVKEMLDLIKANIGHDSAVDWLNRLDALVHTAPESLALRKAESETADGNRPSSAVRTRLD